MRCKPNYSNWARLWARTLVPEPQVERYRSLRWLIYKLEEPLILGDFGCLFETSGARRFKAHSDTDDHIKNVFVPISTDRMLVGSALSNQETLLAQYLNREVAGCSYEYFVSGYCLPTIRELVPSLGTNAGLFAEEELNQMLIELQNGW